MNKIIDILFSGSYWEKLRLTKIITYSIILIAWAIHNFSTYRNYYLYSFINENGVNEINIFQQYFIICILCFPAVWFIIELLIQLEDKILIYFKERFYIEFDIKRKGVFLNKLQNFIILIFRICYLFFSILYLIFILADASVPWFNAYCLLSLIALLLLIFSSVPYF